MLNKILQLELKILSRWILKRYQPIIVAITGSLGKSSAKEAIYLVLKNHYQVRMSPKNYNNELGVPLSIIGVSTGEGNFYSWLKIFLKAVNLILIKEKSYPEILILEMGADHPGDINYLTKIAPPNIGIVTAVSHTHLQYFKNINNVKKEKQVMVENLKSRKKSALAILNYDDQITREMKTVSRVKVLSYGLQKGADLQAQDIIFNFSHGDYELSGVHFKLNYQDSVIPVYIPQIMSESAIYAALVGAAVGIYFKLNLVDIAQTLTNFHLPPGRMNILPGLKHSFLIDDTYNSSPQAAKAALDILSRIKIDPGANKYVVLGDMLELGSYSEEDHRLLGHTFVKLGLSHLIAVGPQAMNIIKGAREAGLKDNYIWHLDKADQVAPFLIPKLKSGDIILLKASQGVRLEKAVKALMAEPELANKYLVRQSSKWLKN